MKPTDFDDPERENIARLKIFTWLGLCEETSSIFSNNFMPDGYGLSEDFINNLNLPTQIFFTGIPNIKISDLLFF